jgi:nicotinamidase-related amidase
MPWAPVSAAYVKPIWAGIGSMVIGRHLFDLTNGWDGTPPAGDHVVVVSGDRNVAVAAGEVGGQAFALGLVDEVAMDVVPVVFGSGKRYFGSVDAQHLLEDPHTVLQGDRVLHLRYQLHVTGSVRIQTGYCLTAAGPPAHDRVMARALVVIDVQESFRQSPIWRAVSNPGIADVASRLAGWARAAGDLVVWVLHAEPETGTVFDPARGFVRFIEPLEPAPGEPVLTKTSHNAFTTTGLQQILTSRGIGELLVAGIRTEQCCETTARLACDLGYQVTFVTDATATHPIAHRDAPADQTVDQLLADPRTLPASTVIERTEYALAGRFAAIATVAELISQPAR